MTELTRKELAAARPLTENRMVEASCSVFPSRVEIDLDALAENVRWLKARVGDNTAVMAVVKANAYGHGAAPVARTALENGAELLAVANLAEAVELRDAGIKAPILVLGYVPADAIPLVIQLEISVSVFDKVVAQQYAAAAEGAHGKLIVHIKVDSGMGRLGVLPKDAIALTNQLQNVDAIEVEGIYTHFSTAGEDLPYAVEQLARFKRVLKQLQSDGRRFKYIHAANSAAVLTFPDSYFNVVRPGLLLYGLQPIQTCAEASALQPVMTWKTRVAQVKTLPPDSPVGYGNAYRTRGKETIAVLPVGYADGLRRSPQTWREVLVRGERAQLVGRVSMEKITINVSHIPGVTTGDEVVLLGKQGGDEISADEIAGWLGTINYEVVTSIAKLTPRTFRGS